MTYIVGSRRFDNPFSFDMALQEPVFHMMSNGFLVDLDTKNEFSEEYNSRWQELQFKLDSVVGRELNVNSKPQVAKWLYNEVGLPVRRHKGEVTTREPALRALLAYCSERMQESKTQQTKMKYLRGYMSIMLILRVRAIRKRISSYINAKVDNDLRMRCTIAVGGTETGRFSHSKTLWGTGCNLATVPLELRRMYVAPDGMELAELDLNRGESWIYAHLSEDPELMRIHTGGGDFHTETAVAIASAFGEYIRDWDEWAGEVGPDRAYKMRYSGKKTNHASAYRMGPFKGAEEFNKEADDTGVTCTVKQFKRAQRLWHQKYIGMKAWWDEIERDLSEDRTLHTYFGRKRTFYDAWGDDLFKEATAYVPQSTSVDYLNTGMLRVFYELVKPRTLDIKLLHQQHDSIIIEYPIERRDIILPAVIDKLRMEIEIKEHRFIIPVEAKYGPRWGKDMVKWKV